MAACKAAGFDLVVVETSGIGQGDAAIVPLVDVPMYVMTPEFGAASQLEKIDMLDFAEFVAINKFDRKGAADALRDVAKQVQRNKRGLQVRPEEMPVFGTMASRFNDDGVTALYQALKVRLAALGLPLTEGRLPPVDTRHSTHQTPIVPPRAPATWPTSATPCAATSAARASRRAGARGAAVARNARACCKPTTRRPAKTARANTVLKLADERARLDRDAAKLLAQWPDMQKAYAGDEYVVKIRDKEIRTALTTPRCRATRSARWLPQFEDHGEI
jgi:methylmalonyl-CoA mutase